MGKEVCRQGTDHGSRVAHPMIFPVRDFLIHSLGTETPWRRIFSEQPLRVIVTAICPHSLYLIDYSTLRKHENEFWNQEPFTIIYTLKNQNEHQFIAETCNIFRIFESPNFFYSSVVKYIHFWNPIVKASRCSQV